MSNIRNLHRQLNNSLTIYSLEMNNRELLRPLHHSTEYTQYYHTFKKIVEYDEDMKYIRWEFREEKDVYLNPNLMDSFLLSISYCSSKRIGKRKVEQYSLAKKLLHIYDSLEIAAKCSGVNIGTICSCCNGRYGRHKNGIGGNYIWKYNNESLEEAPIIHLPMLGEEPGYWE